MWTIMVTTKNIRQDSRAKSATLGSWIMHQTFGGLNLWVLHSIEVLFFFLFSKSGSFSSSTMWCYFIKVWHAKQSGLNFAIWVSKWWSKLYFSPGKDCSQAYFLTWQEWGKMVEDKVNVELNIYFPWNFSFSWLYSLVISILGMLYSLLKRRGIWQELYKGILY